MEASWYEQAIVVHVLQSNTSRLQIKIASLFLTFAITELSWIFQGSLITAVKFFGNHD